MANKSEEKLARRVEQRLISRMTLQSFSGPLPPPEALARYNEIVPNGAERIMQMAENQQRHRHSLEQKVIKANVFDQKLGLILGFVIMAGVAAAGVWLVSTGRDASGTAALVAAVAGPVSAFIYGRKKQSEERAAKS